MRKTLASLGALSLTALSFVYCDSSGTSNTPVDMTSTTVTDLAVPPSTDLAVPSTEDMTSPPPDMIGTVAPTEFSVLRVGPNSVGMPNNDATPGFIERRQISNGALVGTPLALPTAVNGQNKQLMFSGTATLEGQLSRSLDGKVLVVAGYAAGPTDKDVSGSTTYPRVIGSISSTNVINTQYSFPAAAQTVRGVASTDGDSVWIAGDPMIRYARLSQAAAPTSISDLNSRGIGIFGTSSGRQLYVSSFSSTGGTSYLGVSAVGTGTPMTTATVTRLSGFTDTNSPASVGILGFDRDGNGAIDQLYVADDRLVTGGGVQRWKLNGTAWSLEGTISMGTGAGARFLTGFLNGTTVTLLVTTSEAGTTQTRVVSLTDAGGTTTTVAGTLKVLTTAPTNAVYRGVALAPQ